MSYCVAGDLHAFGLPRGATPNPGRTLHSAASNVCTLDQHGFATDDAILFAPGGDTTLPAGLAVGTTYYARRLSEHTFAVQATSGGSTITFTDADDPIVVVAPLDVDSAIAWADALIDDMLPAHVVPIDGDVPAIVRMTSAELAAGKLSAVMGCASKSLAETVDQAQRRLERWSKGVPLRGPDAPEAASLAISATASATDPRGWRRFGSL